MSNTPKHMKSSPMEKCSLVCHLFTFPFGLVYTLWLLVPDENLEAWNITYYPPKEWAIQIPVSAILLFFAVPLIYFGMNSLTVPSPTSLDTICDDYSRKPISEVTTGSKVSNESSSLPEIYDIDPAKVVWFPRER